MHRKGTLPAKAMKDIYQKESLQKDKGIKLSHTVLLQISLAEFNLRYCVVFI